jgi:DNA-binding GntR family transcriptional regulator
LDGCTNRRLKEIASSLRDTAELYRRWSLPLGSGIERDVAAEHEALLSAVLARDADRAAEGLTNHISLTSSILLDTFAAESANM